MDWQQSSEYLAFILISIVTIYFFKGKQGFAPRRKIFSICLILSYSCIIANLISVYTIDHYQQIPPWINMLLNCLYFLLSLWVCTAIAVYIFNLLFEHVYEPEKKKVYLSVLAVINVIYFAIVVSNPHFHTIFWFDEAGLYHQGPLNQSGYFFMLSELSMALICYFQNRRQVSRNITQVMRTLPPIVIVVLILQLIYPELLLNGTIIACAILILYINFQNCQIEVDSLTNLHNRKSFYFEISQRLNKNRQFSIISISLAHFDEFNQRYGHQKGDEMLFSIASWLESINSNGYTFRYKNVSFALLYPASPQVTENLLVQIHQRFEKDWIIENIKCSVSATTSALTRTTEDWTAEQLIDFLENMNIMAKEQDLLHLELNDTIINTVKHRIKLVELLKSSIQEKRFQIWYQPTYNCQTGTFTHVEALVRLTDYEGCYIPPDEFIPLAENNGLIDDITWILIDKICSFLHENPTLPLHSVSVNLSMPQFLNPELIDILTKNIEKYQIAPEQIKLEITERVLSHDLKRVQKTMDKLTELGFGLYLDDFGVGYSNLSTVMHFPLECIKLDRSLFESILENRNDRIIVKSMIKLAHSFDVKVIAEGIETADAATLLQELNADAIQGYYYSRPLPPEQLIEFYK